MSSIAEREQIPDFEGLLCNGETFRNQSLKEVLGDRATVLVFYGFTFNAISENWWRQYERAGLHEMDGVTVYGICRDGPYAQNAFIRYLETPFKMFSDPNGNIIEQLDLLTDRHHMANTATSKRAIYVIDPTRAVQYQWIADDWTSPVPLDEVQNAISEL